MSKDELIRKRKTNKVGFILDLLVLLPRSHEIEARRWLLPGLASILKQGAQHWTMRTN